MGFMVFMWLFWVAVVVAVVILAVRLTSSGTVSGGSRESAEAIVKRRYANGEISRDEYERMLDELRR
jgi:putative membrane protein